MHAIAWWPSLGVLVVAAAIDLCTRRIPNWLVLPFLVSGLVVQSATGGLPGAGRSLAGVGLALVLFGVPCFMRAMGMGDLKLAAGVGAWIGPGQFVMAFIVTGMVGGIMAGCYAIRHRSLGRCLDSTGELVVHLAKGRVPPHEDIRLDSSKVLSIPYAPAIAIGTLFSFFMQ
jgi:prepilin peptidase CpaA